MDDENDPTKMELDLRGPFSLDEIISIERACGLSLAQWFDGRSHEGELRRAIAWVFARRVDPTATVADAGSLMMRVG